MQVLRDINDASDHRGGYVAIGNFDGVHRGHQRMISTLVEQARSDNVPAVVLTFDPHPISLLSPGRVPPTLSTLVRKAELIASCGVDVLIAYPTDHQLLKLLPGEFFERIVRGQLDARGLVEGPNFCFGRDRAGDIDTLRSLCKRGGLKLTVVDPVRDESQNVVSSSAIREAIRTGQIAHAVSMLGHPYRLTGIVEAGARRGASLGFPTANLGQIQTLLPPDGVYAGRCLVDRQIYLAAVHIGSNPTFDETLRKLEVHLLGFSGDLYQQSLSVDLVDRVRDTIRFESAEALKTQLDADLQSVRTLLGAEPS